MPSDAFWADLWESGEGGSKVIPRRPTELVPVRRVQYGAAPQQFCELRLPPLPVAPRLARPIDGEATARVPVAVFVHGGFWKSEWSLDLSHAMAEDLAQHGWASWNIEYRRVGYKSNGYEGQEGAGFPGTLQDVSTALDSLADIRTPDGEPDLDLERVILIGHSAGGHLALWLAQAHRQTTISLLPPLPGAQEHQAASQRRCRIVPLAVVGQAPVADLHEAFAKHLSDDGDATERFMGGGPEDSDELARYYNDVSPAALLPLGCAQLLVSGTEDSDVPIELTRAYAEKVRTTVPADTVTMLEFPGCGHYEIITPMDPTWPQQRAAIEELLQHASASLAAAGYERSVSL